MVLAFANFAQILGEIGFGLLSDPRQCPRSNCRIDKPPPPFQPSYSGDWPTIFAMLIAFALLFGTFGAGLLALWARIGTLFGEKDAPMVYGVLCCTRGIGSIASGPISLAMLGGEVVVGTYGAGRFKSLVLFVGLCLTVSAGLGIDWPCHDCQCDVRRAAAQKGERRWRSTTTQTGPQS